MKAKNKTFRAYFFTKYGHAFKDIKAHSFIEAFKKLPKKYKNNSGYIEDLETDETQTINQILGIEEEI